MKKSSFFTFLFSLWPGAGQMYYGYMKRGISVMSLFCALVAFMAVFYRFNIIGIFLPVIWFFSFFDTYRIRHLMEDPTTAPADDFLFHLSDFSSGRLSGILKRRNILAGGICLVFGAYLLYETVLLPVLNLLDIPILSRFFRDIPTLVVAILIIWLGIYLLKGGTAPKENRDFQEYTGEPKQLSDSNDGGKKND